ncbi:MAG: 2-(1,2-epoxy,2-dihydrophenyl)acetyl-CoA isomerase [Chitinophagaceae bacterium]|nr:2-(1,2-epoxy,2-dihydrophenyl)acetyl-CoA isomerase [Chitinophagaceae bacterium]
MSSVILEIKENVALITLNRPEKLNSFNREMALAMQKVLDDCYTDKSIRCVLITGAGKGFSAGQDLAEVVDSEGPGMDTILSQHYNPIIRRIRNMNKPVVAAINGVAAGAGANIALSCDIVVAAETASFIQAFSKIGLIPDSGGTFFLPRLIGWQKASALMMLGEKVSSQQAEEMGMIYKILQGDNFLDQAFAIAKQLAEMPTQGLLLTRQALEASFKNTLEEQLQEEDRLQQQAGNTADYREGVKAFVEKRKPIFKGE